MDISAIKKMGLYNRLLNDSFWSLTGNILGNGFLLGSGIVIARFLGKDSYGEYGIIRSTILSIAVFSTFGLGYTSTKFIAEYKNLKPQYIKLVLSYFNRISLLVSCILALILFLNAGYISLNLLSDANIKTPLRILSILVIINSLTTTQIGVLAGFGSFKAMARINASVGIVTFTASFILTRYYGLNGALTTLLLTQALSWLLYNNLINKNLSEHVSPVKFDRSLLKEILNFTTPVALQEALYTSTQWLGSFLIIKFSTYGELGLYTAAMQWSSIVIFIPGILRNVILSHFSESNSNEIEHTRILKISLMFTFSVTIIPAIIVFALSNLIMNIYGASFKGLDGLVSIAVFTTVFLSLTNVYAQAFMSKGLNWSMFFIRLFRDIFIILTFFLFIKYWSINSATAMVFSSLILSVITLVIIVFVYIKKNKKKVRQVESLSL